MAFGGKGKGCSSTSSEISALIFEERIRRELRCLLEGIVGESVNNIGNPCVCAICTLWFLNPPDVRLNQEDNNIMTVRNNNPDL